MYLHIPAVSTIMMHTLKATKMTSVMQVGEQIVRRGHKNEMGHNRGSHLAEPQIWKEG
jgi:hypothetical protein